MRILRDARRCIRQVDRLCCIGRSGGLSGKQLRQGARARKPLRLLESRRQSGRDGSENVGVCLHHILYRRQQHRRDGTCRLLNESRLRWRAHGEKAFARSLVNLGERPRRFLVNCGAMLQRVAEVSSIEP